MPSRIRLYLRETSGAVHCGRNVESRLLEMAPVTLRKLRADPRWARQPRWKRCQDLAAGINHSGFSIRRERRGLPARESRYRQALYQAGLLPNRKPARTPTRPAVAEQGFIPLLGVYGRDWVYNSQWLEMSFAWRAHCERTLAAGVRQFIFAGLQYDGYRYISRLRIPPQPTRRPRFQGSSSGGGLFSTEPQSAAPPRPSGPYSPPLGIWRQ